MVRLGVQPSCSYRRGSIPPRLVVDTQRPDPADHSPSFCPGYHSSLHRASECDRLELRLWTFPSPLHGARDGCWNRPSTGLDHGTLGRGRHVRSTCRCSLYPAIHTLTRILLRSSSTHEPSDPPLRVVILFQFVIHSTQWPRPVEPRATVFLGWEVGSVRLFHVRLTPWNVARTGIINYARPRTGKLVDFGQGPPFPSGGPPAFRQSGMVRLSVHSLPAPTGGELGLPPSPRGVWLGCPPFRGWHPPFRMLAQQHVNRNEQPTLVPSFVPSFGNDPSAGSPTETLLRLLLPLNDQVWTSFRQPGATREPPGAPVRRPH